jgi:hypothetical protein
MRPSILLLSGGLFLCACSAEMRLTESDLPPGVLASFQSKYPGAGDVSWEAEKEDDHLVFEAEFQHEGKKKEAYFRPDGMFVKED